MKEFKGTSVPKGARKNLSAWARQYAHCQDTPHSCLEEIDCCDECIFNESNGELIWDLEIFGDYSHAPFAVANEKLFMHKGWDEIYAFG